MVIMLFNLYAYNRLFFPTLVTPVTAAVVSLLTQTEVVAFQDNAFTCAQSVCSGFTCLVAWVTCEALILIQGGGARQGLDMGEQQWAVRSQLRGTRGGCGVGGLAPQGGCHPSWL